MFRSIIAALVAVIFVLPVATSAAEKEMPAVAKAAKGKAAKYVEGKPPTALLRSKLAATPGVYQGKTSLDNPIVKARLKRGLPAFVPPCDVVGKPGVKGVLIANGCAEIMWSKYKDPDTGVVRVVQGLPKKTINGKDYDYKIGDTLPIDWKQCGSLRVWVDGTNYDADGHVNCVD